MNKTKFIVRNKFLSNNKIDKVYNKINIYCDVSYKFYKYIINNYEPNGVRVYNPFLNFNENEHNLVYYINNKSVKKLTNA